MRRCHGSVGIEKPAQISLRGLSPDGPRVEGLAARTDALEIMGACWRRDLHDERSQSSPERGLDGTFI